MKNIKENILYLIVIVLGLLAVYRLYNYLYSEHQCENHTDLTYEIFVESINVNGKEFPDLDFINIDNEKRENIIKVLENHRTLVLVFSEHSCNECMEILFEKLQEMQIKGIKVIGIGHAHSLHYLTRYSKAKNIDYMKYYDKNNELVKKMNIKITPAVFYVNNQREIINSIFVTPATVNYIEIFFNRIEKTALQKGNN